MSASVSAGALARALARHEAVAKSKLVDTGLTVLSLDPEGLRLRTAGEGREAQTDFQVQGPSPSPSLDRHLPGLSCLVNARALRTVAERMDRAESLRLDLDLAQPEKTPRSGHALRLVLEQGARRVELATLPAERAPRPLVSTGAPWLDVDPEPLRWALASAARFAKGDLVLALWRGWFLVTAHNGYAVWLSRHPIQKIESDPGPGQAWCAQLSQASAAEWVKLLAKAGGAQIQASGGDGETLVGDFLTRAPTDRPPPWTTIRLGACVDTLSLRVDGVTLSERCATGPWSDQIHSVEQVFGDRAPPAFAGRPTTLRVAPQQLVASLKALAVTTLDTDDYSPMLDAQAGELGITLVTEVQGSLSGQTRELVEGLCTLGDELAGSPYAHQQRTARANERYLRAAAEAGVGGPDDLDVGWRCYPSGDPVRPSASAWFVRPTGFDLGTTPWFVLVMGAAR